MNNTWKTPPRIKVYEALGCVADGRLRLTESGAEVDASSKNKTYTVTYDTEKNAMRSNDNGSYWQGYLGYPAIALLMLEGVLEYNKDCALALKGIQWKKVNTEFKNDYNKTEEYCLDLVESRGVLRQVMNQEVDRILQSVEQLNIEKLGKRTPPAKEK